ncbi:sugar phosphate nucleotidyltransferase [Undibacterium sp. Di26W]|uniref:sugar phosphate nucleotidyltransferase n=1 Tax=Undibacterium sp. Di26W TaxID=3413035 RepID=UPI003BF1CA01
MQIVIPMSGFGERFRKAGYTVPKPLIEVDGKPIIAYVIDMFPGEENFLFICNQDHLANAEFRMEEILRKYCPNGQILGIPPHKLGPLYAIQQAEHLIDPESPVVINYCDFNCYWDWFHFKQFVHRSKCAGAIPAYKGFHPHSLGDTNYAYLREENGWVSDIQEKQAFTSNRMDEFASSGTYYFDSGRLLSDSTRSVIEQGMHIGGEYYASLAYKSVLVKHLKVAVYPLQHFMQWGTPEDLFEYNEWSAIFKRLMAEDELTQSVSGSLIIPMAGLGQRFVNEGYTLGKPLIPVSGKPMVAQAISDLPQVKNHAFVLRQDMIGCVELSAYLEHTYSESSITRISSVTEGQACTALLGLEVLEKSNGELVEPITIGTCDNGMLYDQRAFLRLVENLDIDVIVWGVRGHANALRHPGMFGWIDEENGLIRQISVKSPLKSPAIDPIVLGTFTFRRKEDFRNAVQRLIEREGRINGEFYIDSCINDAIALGLRCYLFEVDNYLSWGTPNDLRTFEYWQSCFHKWSGHPYRLELDKRISKISIANLDRQYQAIVPELPSE